MPARGERFGSGCWRASSATPAGGSSTGPHFRFYNRRTAVEMLEQSGFAVEEVVGTIPVPLLHAEPLCRMAHRLGNLRPSLFAYTFVVTAHLNCGCSAPRGSSRFRH